MDTLRGMLRSKTINVNTLATLLLVSFLQYRGVDMDPATAASLVALAYGLVNIWLRFLTNKSLPEKGLVIPNPPAVQQTVTAIEDNKQALDALIDALRARIAERKGGLE